MSTEHFLITTSDERSWKNDQRPVLFLGEWCTLYNRKAIWSEFDLKVAIPFCVSTRQKQEALEYTQALRNQLLLELTEKLNTIHNTHHDSKYWNILIGRWLFRYVDVFYNRYHCIEQVLNNYQISSTAVLESNYSLTTPDSMTFIYACGDPLWNHVVYKKALRFLNFDAKKTEGFRVPEINKYEKNFTPPGQAEASLKRSIIKGVFSFLSLFKSRNDAVIANSYIPKKDELKLQVLMGQCPQLWITPELDEVDVRTDLRKKLELSLEGLSGFEKFIRHELSEVLPTCFLEGYQSLVQKGVQLPWPANPKFIFTSNLFDTDEVFKCWTAQKVEDGSAYFVGQHGNNYGTILGFPTWPEFVTPERFISWGWHYNNKKYVPAFNFKIIGKEARQYNKNGGLLLIEVYVPHQILPWDDYYEFGIYQEDQFKFAKSLPKSIHGQLTVRLHAQYRNHKWYEVERWTDSSPDTNLEKGEARIFDLISSSRLVVHSYDSTGILETLALDIPTISFWRNGFDHLIPEAKPFYQLLKDASIIFDTPEEAAAFINENWSNIEEWWRSKKVQDARKIFCENYSRVEKRPLLKLKSILNECAENRP